MELLRIFIVVSKSIVFVQSWVEDVQRVRAEALDVTKVWFRITGGGADVDGMYVYDRENQHGPVYRKQGDRNWKLAKGALKENPVRIYYHFQYFLSFCPSRHFSCIFLASCRQYSKMHRYARNTVHLFSIAPHRICVRIASPVIVVCIFSIVNACTLLLT